MAKVSPSEATQLNQACLADKLRLLNRVITNLYDDALRPTGMTAAQMTILVVVAKYGEASPRQIGQWLHLEKSTLSRNVRRLEQHRWLRSTPAKKGHSHTLKLTSKGHEALRKGTPFWESAQQEAKTLLGKSGANEIMRAVEKFRSQET